MKNINFHRTPFDNIRAFRKWLMTAEGHNARNEALNLTSDYMAILFNAWLHSNREGGAK